MYFLTTHDLRTENLDHLPVEKTFECNCNVIFAAIS